MSLRIKRSFDVPNLVRELAENKVDSLELIREGLSNAKDHGAERIWIHSFRDNPRSPPSVVLIDDGEGMSPARLAAFWGVGATHKGERQAIGYKGHGTKLFFASQRLSVATRAKGDAGWSLCTVDSPSDMLPDFEIPLDPLPTSHALHAYLVKLGLLEHAGS
ncbi:MAG: ATP-binding protein, partial [Byssovorax sp.]